MSSVPSRYLWHTEEMITVGKAEVYDEKLHLKPGFTMNYRFFMVVQGQLIF